MLPSHFTFLFALHFFPAALLRRQYGGRGGPAQQTEKSMKNKAKLQPKEQDVTLV